MALEVIIFNLEFARMNTVTMHNVMDALAYIEAVVKSNRQVICYIVDEDNNILASRARLI